MVDKHVLILELYKQVNNAYIYILFLYSGYIVKLDANKVYNMDIYKLNKKGTSG